ncbi:MAG: tetratricopeptide (TPR) repeat protein [Bacteroidia bacterium]|jgi:tetratricopeptide (TPR) repeat protein
MKTWIFLLCGGLFIASCNSNSGTDSAKTSFETNEALYERALDLGDYGTALVALNYMLLEDSTNMEYTDSLARIYMRSGSFDAGLNLGQKVMDGDAKNYKLLELIATAQEYKGDPPNLIKAYRNYKILHEEFKGTRYLLKLAQVGMMQGTYQASMKKLEEVIASESVTLIESPTSDGGVQMIDVKAGANMLKANYYFNEGQEKLGAQCLEQALKITPDYEAARLMVQRLQQFQQQKAAMGQQQAYQQQQGRQAEINRKKAEQKRLEEQFLKNK